MKKKPSHAKRIEPYSGIQNLDVHEYFESHAYLSREDWNKLNKLPCRPIGWLQTDEKLKLFFDTLTKYSLISCPYDIFSKHFKKSDVGTKKIEWLGFANSLTFLLKELMAEFCVPSTFSPYKMIELHFVDSRGNDFNVNRLRKNNSKGIRNPENQGNMERIVESLIK